MKILVTGGAGYIGSHVVHALISSGHDVWAYDNLSAGHAKSVPSDILVIGDLIDKRKLIKVMQELQIDTVMHFAALAIVSESTSDPSRYYQNNVIATLCLLEAMRESEVNRIIFSSTTATYGQPREVPITESTLQQPINPYGFTKLVIERAISDYADAYNFGAVILRYFNAAGASPLIDIGEDHKPETHLIPSALQVALGQRSSIDIFGTDYPTRDGTCIRDYVHVSDLSNAHLRSLDVLSAGTVLKFNIGIGHGYSVLEVINACRKVTGHRIPIRTQQRRPGDPAELVADSNLAKQKLQWTPHYTYIEDIIETAWRWHKKHPLGYSGQ